MLRDKGVVLYQQHWHSTWYSRETLEKKSTLVLTVFSASRERSVLSLDTRLSSLKMIFSSLETCLTSLERRIALRERVVTYFSLFKNNYHRAYSCDLWLVKETCQHFEAICCSDCLPFAVLLCLYQVIYFSGSSGAKDILLSSFLYETSCCISTIRYLGKQDNLLFQCWFVILVPAECAILNMDHLCGD